ncbi:RNA-directed DNA polymerase, eukaryota, reverse transcriptase zinc-binding domain protein [Tanacetum coccineum]
MLKVQLKSLAWKNGNLHDRVEKCRDKLKNAQILMEKNPLDDQLKKEEAECLSLYLEVVEDEESFMLQKAKLDWISKGDRNTKFFHKIIKSRENLNKITSVCNEKGEKFEGNVVKISHEDAENMIKEVTEDEIKEAMFDIGENKAPGPDGFTSTFFKKSWSVIGKDICLAIQDFFKNGELLGEVNAIVISLIPKIQQPNKISDFRPIACCNVLYKCISKILTKRIKSSLDKIVNPNQSVFIPGRIIQDNLMLSQELFKGYNCKNGHSRCALKIDIAKAYDTVNWRFLEKMLMSFGFHKRMVEWIMKSVSSASFTIGINGERHGFFRSERGLRQADPISPYLFTLVMEVFSLILARKVERNNAFKFHKGCKDLKMTHLSFADDLLVFCHGDNKSVNALVEFSKVSGLFPNMEKSVVFFGSVKENVKKDILQTLPFNVGKLPMKYLGIPLLAKILGIKECKCLMDKVKNKVLDWKNKFLSYAGRLQLITSVLSAMQAYWAAVVKIPKIIINDIDRVLKKFLWSNNELSKGRSKVSWKIVCKPKCEDSLWVKWVNVVKLKGKRFWNISEERNDSCTWKALLEMRYKVRPFFVHVVGNGKDIDIWSDNWCTISHMNQLISNSMLSDARINDNFLRLNENMKDEVKWKSSEGKLIDFNIKNAWWDLRDKMESVKWWKVRKLESRMNMTNVPSDWKYITKKLANHPSNNVVRSVVRRIIVGTAVYYIWKERNSRIFNNTKVPCENVLQMIMENIRLQIQRLQVKKTKQCLAKALAGMIGYLNHAIKLYYNAGFQLKFLVSWSPLGVTVPKCASCLFQIGLGRNLERYAWHIGRSNSGGCTIR